jgi:hypothetical protein
MPGMSSPGILIGRLGDGNANLAIAPPVRQKRAAYIARASKIPK